jgi:hypothetical protein
MDDLRSATAILAKALVQNDKTGEVTGIYEDSCFSVPWIFIKIGDVIDDYLICEASC